jgi:hypothetical protein
MRTKLLRSFLVVVGISALSALALSLTHKAYAQRNELTITISSSVPSELNPPFRPGPPASGGAPSATPAQAAAFAWQEFIALNWPAGPQQGEPDQRDTPSSTCRFGDPLCTGPTVWETFRSKAELFPGTGSPPGYPGPNGDPSLGYDALPQYRYNTDIPACDPDQATNPVPWINLDETDQITLDNMYAGVVRLDSSPNNSEPRLIRFLAKANRTLYVYMAGNSSPSDPMNQWWFAIPADVATATKNYLAQNNASPPPGSSTMVSLPFGTIEVKAGWRALNPDEIASGRFHTQTVRFYEDGGALPNSPPACYWDATWGLVALHIIQKTPSAPYFIYATFEQADNILTESGEPVEDVNGEMIRPVHAPSTFPQRCLVDPQPPVGPPDPDPMASLLGSIILTSDPETCEPLATAQYCDAPGSRLYYHNATSAHDVPSQGKICINTRDNEIPEDVIAANKTAHAAIAKYLRQHGIASAPWLYYKLINVQYFPYDKEITPGAPNGSLYTSTPPFTATNPSAATYYQANIVVETNRSLQLFAGGLSPSPTASVVTGWNQDGTPHKNTRYNGHFYNMGGCMGCHGSQGQNRQTLPGDFSVILGAGHVHVPEIPALERPTGEVDKVPRNRAIHIPPAEAEFPPQ